eukprot:14046259-Alexandrium_andersonii.AAC.1
MGVAAPEGSAPRAFAWASPPGPGAMGSGPARPCIPAPGRSSRVSAAKVSGLGSSSNGST